VFTLFNSKLLNVNTDRPATAGAGTRSRGQYKPAAVAQSGVGVVRGSTVGGGSGAGGQQDESSDVRSMNTPPQRFSGVSSVETTPRPGWVNTIIISY